MWLPILLRKFVCQIKIYQICFKRSQIVLRSIIEYSTTMPHSPSHGLNPRNNPLKLRLDIMLRQPAQVRPARNPRPELLVRLPLPIRGLLLRHPPPPLREGVDPREQPVDEGAAGLVVQPQGPVELLLGGRRYVGGD